MPRFRKRVYSGVCRCGHSAEDHHTGFVMNQDYFEETGESKVYEECEFYGFNERGGLDSQGKDHCHRYVDRDDPEVGD